MGVAAAASLVWASLELVFLGVTMLYLAPRMNRLEVPAKVRCAQCMERLQVCLVILAFLHFLGDGDLSVFRFMSYWYLVRID